MDAFFNELSQSPLPSDRNAVNGIISDYALLIKRGFENGFKKVRYEVDLSQIEVSEGYSLSQYCYDNKRDKNVILLLSTKKYPMFEDNSYEEKAYLSSTFQLKQNDDDVGEIIDAEPQGFVAAMLHNSIAYSWKTHARWISNRKFKISEHGEKNGEEAESEMEVYGFSNAGDFDSKEFIEWATEYKYCDWPEYRGRKTVKLSSDHHGNDELESFAKNKLFRLSYVIEVPTSIAMDSHCKTFVKGIRDEEMAIEVCLHWTDAGYGMLVKTTATDVVQLRQMAKDLDNRFGPKKY